MALEVLLLKQPYEISFAGNPMPYAFALTPYGILEQSQDISVNIRVLVEQVFGTGIFQDVYSQRFNPDNEGKIQFDVRTIIDPYLEYFMPRPTLQKPVQAVRQRKRYRIAYTLMKDGAALSLPVQSVILNAIKGGLSYEQWSPTDFFNQHILADKQPLQYAAKGEMVGFNEQRFFFWLYPYTDTAEQKVKFEIYTTGNAVHEIELPTTINCGKWGICCVPVGFNQMQLGSNLALGEVPIKYVVKVLAGAVLVATATYTLEQRKFYKTTQLIYRNSIGGLETLRLRGQIDFEADYDRQQAQRTVPPDAYRDLILLPQMEESAILETEKQRGDTGFLSLPAADKTRDLFLSKEKYEWTRGRMLPVVLLNKNTKFYSNKENLISILIEWQRAYSNEFYTPVELLPAGRTCPALESFSVKQLNKNQLQIAYSLQIPYDKIEVEITIGTVVFTYQYTGNARSVKQNFSNPDGVTSATVKGRTVCDDQSTPPSLGPYTTVAVEISTNSLPVANDDTYYIAGGYNTAVTLQGSALANDYDPDGDPIEAVAVTGDTDAGGTYSIDAAGVVQYTPPTSGFTGVDFFFYEIREIGGAVTVQGRITIHVGAAAANIFARIVTRNIVDGANGSMTYSTADVYIEYFRDPAGTIPMDVTGLNLIVNYRRTITDQDNAGGVTSSYTDHTINNPSGVRSLIFQGIILSTDYQSGWDTQEIHQVDHILLAGTGYIVI